MQAPEWSDFRVVLAVARGKTLRASAFALHVNQSTVSRRLAALESVLGVTLFERLDGAFSATAAGEIVIEAAESMEQQVFAILEQVANRDAIVAGNVRVTTVPTIANHILIPAMSTLKREHPSLCIELISDLRDFSITRREADIALRFARPSRDDGMLCRCLGKIEYSVFHVTGTKPDELPWLTFEDSQSRVPQARWMASVSGAEDPPALLFNDGDAIIHAVRSGLGKSLLPRFLQSRFEDLETSPSHGTVLTREIWLIVHPQLRHLARVQAVMSWITTVLAVVSKAEANQHPTALRTERTS